MREFVNGYYQPETKREGTGHVATTAPVPFVAAPSPTVDIMQSVQKPEKRAMRTLMTPEDMMSELHTPYSVSQPLILYRIRHPVVRHSDPRALPSTNSGLAQEAASPKS